MPKLNGMPVFSHEVQHRDPLELLAGDGPQAGLLFDAPADFVDARRPSPASASTNDSTFRSGGTNSQRLRVARVHDRKRLKRAARLADADDLRLVVVHFEPLADPRLLVRPEQLVAFEVHDHGVRLAQIEQVAQDHFGGAPTSVASSRPSRIIC